MIRRRILVIVAAGLMLGAVASGQNPQEIKAPPAGGQPAHAFAQELAQRLSNNLRVKTIVGEPFKINSLTLIPILTTEFAFGGAAVAPPAGPAVVEAQSSTAGPDAFFVTGEARPLGFIVIGKGGTRFIPVANMTTK